jgi:hypothetical protein
LARHDHLWANLARHDQPLVALRQIWLKVVALRQICEGLGLLSQGSQPKVFGD